MTTAWTVVDRLRVCKDRRAKLLASLDSGAAAVQPLAAHGLRLFAWSAKTPGRAVFASGTGVYACVVAKDLVLAEDKQAAALREAAPTEAEAAAARLEKELAAGGKPFSAVGSAVCFAPGTLEWVFAPFPPAADTPVTSSTTLRRRCRALDAALCPPVSLTPALPMPFAFPSPVPTLLGGTGLDTPTVHGAAAAGSAIIAASPTTSLPVITKRLEAAMSEADGTEADCPFSLPAAAGPACADSDSGSPRAVAVVHAPSLTSTCSCEDNPAAPADGEAAALPAAVPVLREKADSFVLELSAHLPAVSSSGASAFPACALGALGAAAPPAPAPFPAAGSPLVRLRSTKRFFVLDLMPAGGSTVASIPPAAACCTTALDAPGGATFGSPLHKALLGAEAACASSLEAPPAGAAGSVAPHAAQEAAAPDAGASTPGSSRDSRLPGTWMLAALAGVSGAALVAMRWRGH